MTLHELLEKPVWQMTGEELLFLAQQGSIQREGDTQDKTPAKEERHFVYGLSGLARLFGCSLPTANRIKQSGKIDRAITQVGRKIIVNADLALELAGRKSGDERLHPVLRSITRYGGGMETLAHPSNRRIHPPSRSAPCG